MMIPTYFECGCCGAGQLAQVVGQQKIATIELAINFANPCFCCGYENHPLFMTIEIPMVPQPRIIS